MRHTLPAIMLLSILAVAHAEPVTTAPMADVGELQRENMALRAEVASLKWQLAKLSPPATAPAVASDNSVVRVEDFLKGLPKELDITNSEDALRADAIQKWIAENRVGRRMTAHGRWEGAKPIDGGISATIANRIGNANPTAAGQECMIDLVFPASASGSLLKISGDQDVKVVGTIVDASVRLNNRTGRIVVDAKMQNCELAK